ncbi:MAG: TIGR02679 domain-containing protein [Clostridia bacterium]|nr:TIGR02679 domain-containing protein [Clostridia bacterium]
MNNCDELNSCVNYFKSKNGYNRAFEQMKKKWRHYGRSAGYIILDNPSDSEKELLGGFLGKDFNNTEKIKFSMSDFEKALSETKYKNITLYDLLETYFGEKLITNKEYKTEKINEKSDFFSAIIKRISSEYGDECSSVRWLENIRKNKNYGYKLIISEYEKSKAETENIIYNVCSAFEYLNHISENGIRLAILAAEITRNPHYFDRNLVAGKLLIQLLSFLQNKSGNMSAEEILQLYYSYGIKPDDISSFTTAYGIRLYTENGIHQAYSEFIKNKESYVITLSNLGKITGADCESKKVYVFENQTVFSHICEELKDMKISALCTSGQMKTASLLLIDMLCRSDCEIYYSGDTDPEGILIANKIICRNPQKIRPWRMTVQDYYDSISDKPVTDERLIQFDGVTDTRLFDVCTAVKKEKLAGYQEQLIDKMIEDIKTEFYVGNS